MQSLRLGRIAKFVGIFLLCCLVNVLFYGLPQRANIVTIKAFSDSLSQSNAQNVNCISTDSEQEHKAAAVNMDIVPDQEEKPLANLTKEEKEIKLRIALENADDEAVVLEEVTDAEDPNIEYAADNEKWVYELNYNLSHPFENDCRYPVLDKDDIDLDGQISHYRVIDCSNKTAQPPLVTQLRNGEILVGRPHQSPIRSFKCAYAEMTGTIYPRHRTVTLGKWTNLPIGKRIFIQKDQFVIKCFAKGQLVFHNSFVWISDKPRLNPFSVKAPTKYNIAIFTIDSTSRNQFRRHLPLTMKVMAESGFEHFTGFTKIGDNSAINLLPILTGRVFGAGSRSLVGLVSNDSFYEQKNADFSTFKDSLIAQAREAGCATLWNDEIGQTGMGLFHYYNFGGFRKPVADYYYRPFYEYGMQKFNGMFGCDHQDQFLPKWVNIFEQFSTKYADRCHFSFNFITTLTHGSANNAELFDVPLSEALTRMKAAGVLDNTVIVLQGDHGQRISWIQRRYVGRIEERMSQMSIHLPDKFKTEYPEAYENFVKNSNRLTSNFDVYETLQDIMDKTLEKTTKRTEKHGRSLFTEIPKNRTCQDAMIPENFCVCMEKSPNKVQMAKFTKDISPLIQTRLSETLDPTCMKDFSIDLNDDYQYYTVSKKVRAGQRYPSHKYNADVAREINEIEVKGKLTINLKNGKSISGSITTRVQANSARSELKINASPLVRFEQCPSIFAPEFLCSCQT